MNDLNENKSIDELRAEAAETRQRVSEDVEALAYKVSPHNLKEEAKQSMRDAGHRAVDNVKDAGHRALDTVKDSATEAAVATRGMASNLGRAARENPIPTAMIGVGLGWLAYAAMNRGRTVSSNERYPRAYTYDGSTGRQRRGEAIRGRAERYGSQLSEMAEHGLDKTSAMARDATHTAERRARQMANQATSLYEDNPLVVGALTLGAGLAIGSMLPHTPLEDEVVGGYRDQLFDRVRDGASNAMEQGKSALADAAADVAKNATKQAMSSSNTSSAPYSEGSTTRTGQVHNGI